MERLTVRIPGEATMMPPGTPALWMPGAFKLLDLDQRFSADVMQFLKHAIPI